jgi:hypothetical protein
MPVESALRLAPFLASPWASDRYLQGKELVSVVRHQRQFCVKLSWSWTRCNRVVSGIIQFMENAVDALILDLLEWVAGRERTYRDVLEAWRTSCPRLPVWEDAIDRGLVRRERVEGRSIVTVTAKGFALLEEFGRVSLGGGQE